MAHPLYRSNEKQIKAPGNEGQRDLNWPRGFFYYLNTLLIKFSHFNFIHNKRSSALYNTTRYIYHILCREGTNNLLIISDWVALYIYMTASSFYILYVYMTGDIKL